jgi:hypothetical protein
VYRNTVVGKRQRVLLLILSQALLACAPVREVREEKTLEEFAMIGRKQMGQFVYDYILA